MTMRSDSVSRSTAFLFWSLATAALTFGLTVFGAIVRVTESGLGCGNDWPLCNGTVFPPLSNVHAWIEWLHRLFAALIGLFGMVTLAIAWRRYRDRDRRVLRMTLAAALLFALQSALGAIVVFLDLPPTFVTLHLGAAMLLLGALLAAAVVAWYQPQLTGDPRSSISLGALNAAFALLIILTGALVRGSGATLACTEWPLCDGGALLPIDQGPLAVIHMIHRLSVAAMGLSLLILIRQVFQNQAQKLLRQLAMAAGCTYLLQIGAGAIFVISAAGPFWGAVHVGLAAAVWGILVVVAVIEHIDRGAAHKPERGAND